MEVDTSVMIILVMSWNTSTTAQVWLSWFCHKIVMDVHAWQKTLPTVTNTYNHGSVFFLVWGSSWIAKMIQLDKLAPMFSSLLCDSIGITWGKLTLKARLTVNFPKHLQWKIYLMKTGEASLNTGLIRSIRYIIYMWSDQCWSPIYACATQIYLLVGELFKEQGQPYESEIPTDDKIS